VARNVRSIVGVQDIFLSGEDSTLKTSFCCSILTPLAACVLCGFARALSMFTHQTQRAVPWLLRMLRLQRMVAQHLVVLAYLNLSFFSCRQVLGNSNNAKQMSGILMGTITRGPISPVIEPDVVYTPVPVEGVKVRVTSLSGKLSASTVTDEGGNFRIVLFPGVYEVTLGPLDRGGFSKDVPARVTISAGLATRIAIHIDSGIR
jgi:hypothetical protein